MDSKLLLFLIFVAMVSCSNTGDSRLSDRNNTAPAVTASAAPNTADVVFDADSAMAYLKAQTDMGPRYPGSDSHKLCGDYLAAELSLRGATVTDRTVTTLNPDSGKNVPVRNILGRFNPDAADRILVLAHYDTRPWADMENDTNLHDKPIDGANDGASGVAVALELARLSSALPSTRGLDILFVDMEDSGSYGNDESWCLGSRRWAQHDMPYNAANMPRFAVLLDMVGGKDAVFMREYFSEMYARPINDMIWQAAAKAGHASRFVDRVGGAINDDHISLLGVGIPAVDIIEMRVDGENGGFNPTWHTLQDNFANIDPATIKAVGDVMTQLIYK